METHGFLGGVHNVLEWISRLALLNILWIFFSIVGLGIFGFFPATAAMFSVVRRWSLREMDFSIFLTFWKAYKKEFIKSNILGMILKLIGIVLIIDVYYLKQASSFIQQLLSVPFLILSILFVCMLLYVFPMYVHYEMKVLQVLKNSFFVMIMNPLSTLMMLVCGAGLMILLSFAPPLLLICSGNLLALLITRPAMNAFQKINDKQQERRVQNGKRQELINQE